jgi:hypothetical protein
LVILLLPLLAEISIILETNCLELLYVLYRVPFKVLLMGNPLDGNLGNCKLILEKHVIKLHFPETSEPFENK